MKMVFRDAESSDCDAVAALHALSWRTAYQGILTQTFLDEGADANRLPVWRARLSGVRPERQWVRLAVNGDELVGFACVCLDHDERWGALLDNLHVHPDVKGRAIGRQLMAQAASRVVERRPASSLYLWVYEANHAARGFYEHFDGVAVERARRRAPDGRDVRVVRYVWTDLRALVARADVSIVD